MVLKGRYQEAVEDFATVVQRDQTNIDTWVRLGQTLAASGRLQEALTGLNNPALLIQQEMKDFPLGSNPEDDSSRKLEAAELFYQRAMVHHRLKDEPRALQDLDTALTFSPQNKVYLNAAGVCQNSTGATKVEPTYMRIFCNISNSCGAGSSRILHCSLEA